MLERAGELEDSGEDEGEGAQKRVMVQSAQGEDWLGSSGRHRGSVFFMQSFMPIVF